MAIVNITINGRKIQAQAGQTVYTAATNAGIDIPVLCHHPALPPEGACRVCLVEIEKQRNLQPACTYPVTEGMVIHTRSPKVMEARKFALELIVSDHPLDCMTCEATGDCRLQDLAYEYNVKGTAFGSGRQHQYPIDDPNPFIQVDRNKCILCRRCVRACDYINGVEAISIVYRGFNAKLAFGMDSTMEDSPCEFCGSCVEVCPVGALWPKMSIGKGRAYQLRQVETICSYCGVGCRLTLHLRGNEIVKVSGADGAANHGFTCVKGRFGYDYVNHADRLKKPLVRRYLLEGKPKPRPVETLHATSLPSGNGHAPDPDMEWVETSWEQALSLVVNKWVATKQAHGADAFAALCSARCTNEENYLAAKLTRQLMETHNIDHCARLCHASTVTGLAAAFGSGAMTNTIDDIAEQAQCLFIIGSNTTEQHPVFGMRLRQAVKQRGVPLIVADPRRIPITQFATIHLRHKPGTDTALLNGLMHVLIAEDLYDHEFVATRTEGFEDLKAKLEEYPPERVAEICGVPAEDIRKAARLMAAHKPTAMMYAMGITQHTSGHGNVLSCANLQMLLGNMGIPGGGVNPLRGQSNVQGACDMGGLPNVYSGYQSVALEATHKKFEAAWGAVPPNDKPGLTVVEMMNAAVAGKVKAMYIFGENPMLSDPDLNHVRHALESLDFLVVQDIFMTETAQLADVVLPGTTFAEKDGTFTNTERRVQLLRRALDPLEDVRPDWQIIAELSQQLLAAGVLGERTAAVETAPYGSWEYLNPAEIMDEIAALTPSYGGIRHQRLLSSKGLQWPCPDDKHPGTPILHVGKFTRGLGKLTPVDYLPPAELPDEEYPLLLTTGRVLWHYHTGSLTRRSEGLAAIYPEGLIEMHPEDAARLDVANGEVVEVASRRGQVTVKADVTEKIAPGVVFMTFHFAESAVNFLTNSAFDPVAKIPEFKACAVKVAKLPNSECVTC